MDSDHLFGILKLFLHIKRNDFLYVLIPIQKKRNYFKHAELSVFSVLDLALYSKQLTNCHSSVIIQAKYDISMNQLFTKRNDFFAQA
jgi:GTPase involved in cell partitioning and DNA repair